MATKKKICLDGLVLPSFPPLVTDARKRLTDIENLSMRKDDVIISSVPKSGNHWLTEIVPRLLHSELDFDRTMSESFLELMPDVMTLQAMPSPRLMISHLPFKYLPKEHRENRGKFMHIIRNPKDVAVSAFHHFTTDPMAKDYVSPEWSEFLDEYLRGDIFYGSWFDRELEWEKAALENPENILIIYYEELKINGLETMKAIAKFLGSSPDVAFLQAVYDKCSIDEVKKRKMGTGFEYLFRKGIVDDWKSLFTDAQNEKFNRVFNERMKGSKLHVQMNT